MKTYSCLAFLLFFLSGCAAYKELEPDPELTTIERGYIELKDGKKTFELDKDKKYFIKFPRPTADHFNLVLITPVKPALDANLTSTFDKGKGPINIIPNEASSSDSIYAYAIDTRVPVYYWIIETVRQDLVLSLKYRYVPQWRYIFENK